jgi:hypothetical protein
MSWRHIRVLFIAKPVKRHNVLLVTQFFQHEPSAVLFFFLSFFLSSGFHIGE